MKILVVIFSEEGKILNSFSETINERVERIRFLNAEKSEFIQDYKPFIAATVEKCVGRYVTYGQDDELSIGLIAFEEAINHYDLGKGNFLSFAQNVIKRRIIDYYRKEKRHQNVTSINDYYPDESEGDNVYDYITTAEQIQSQYYEQEVNDLRRMEIIQLKSELEKFDLSFSDIAKSSPKHKGTKSAYLDIVKFIVGNKEITDKIKQKKYIPVAEIQMATNLPRKTIERSRNYVIAAVLILTGDYYSLREYIDWGV
ncbi:MAG: RNA polymerase sigma-I factor [Clostridiales bacterium GWB2_37_7]|nr:MAG: RNA polymerase sigma-I factor [Clostridiales bacterium GWB2_37_7]